MRKVIKDYFTPYAEPGELTFVRRSRAEELVFILWEPIFGAFMDAVTPTETGWTSLALMYHMDKGWYEDEDWQVPDPAKALAQLEALHREQLSDQEREILDELSAFIRQGIQAGDELHIQYF